MKNRTKKLISVLCICIMLLGVGIGAHADTSVELENYELKALGRIEHDKDGSGIAGDHPSDFVYDADDLYAIEGLVKDGKTDLSTVINSYPNASVQTLDTFDNLTAAIDSLTEFPAGTYYYDSTTGTDDASELIRYIKENDTYYLCDQNGNKTSDEAQTVDENNLVEYTEMSAENLTAGTAGMVDKAFVLGNGSDNISYRNLGDTIVNTNSASYNAGYTAGVTAAKPKGTVLTQHNSDNANDDGSYDSSTLSYYATSDMTIFVVVDWSTTNYQERYTPTTATVTCSNGSSALVSALVIEGEKRNRVNVFKVDAKKNSTITATTPLCETANILLIN